MLPASVIMAFTSVARCRYFYIFCSMCFADCTFLGIIIIIINYRLYSLGWALASSVAVVVVVAVAAAGVNVSDFFYFYFMVQWYYF